MEENGEPSREYPSHCLLRCIPAIQTARKLASNSIALTPLGAAKAHKQNGSSGASRAKKLPFAPPLPLPASDPEQSPDQWIE